MRPRISGVPAGLLAALLVPLTAVVWTAPTSAQPPDPSLSFVQRTLDETTDQRDTLARSFNPVQLPLLAASLAASDTPGLEPGDAYRACARWHFWQGNRWDPTHDGLWQVESSTVPAGAGREGQTLAAHAGLELVQLRALARIAARADHWFDALTWWSDHDRLGRRLNRVLFDPLAGAYCDLDSLRTRLPVRGVSSLLPLAYGAPAAGPLSRDAAWRLWTDGPPPTEGASSPASAHALDLADSFHGWSHDAGLRLFDPATSASLALRAVERLKDPDLATVVRHAFRSVGIETAETLRLHIGSWSPLLPLDALDPVAFERSRVAIEVLHRGGVLTAGRADSLRTRIDAFAPGGEVEVATVLTELLLELRALNPRLERHSWASRRAKGLAPVNGDGAVFHLRWDDTNAWFVPSLDLLLTDILDARRVDSPKSLWRAWFEPQVIGRGGEVDLVLHCSIPSEVRALAGAPIDVVWTDGRRVLPARSTTMTLRDDQTLVARLTRPPEDLGLWSAILEGRPAPVRRVPVLPVVQPVSATIRPVARNGRAVTVHARIESHVRAPQSGRIDLELPISWDVAPGTSATFDLPPGGSTEIAFELTPAPDESPGLYSVRWHLFDTRRETMTLDGSLSIPFAWLHLGPVPASHDRWIDSEHATDTRVDLSERYRGPAGTVGWTRMPTASIAADGWIELARPSDPLGLHYAYTAFTTNSRESTIRVESSGAVEVSVDGRVVGRVDRWGGDKTFEADFHSGINHLLVKVIGGGGRSARFRLDVRDIDTQPLRAVGNSLEHLLDAYAYLARSGEAVSDGRHDLRLVPITFRDPTAQRVSVVGSFNGWSPSATPMTPLGDGRWQAKIRLRPGRFEYKIAVDGRDWIVDPNNPEAVSDGFGGRNSVLVVE